MDDHSWRWQWRLCLYTAILSNQKTGTQFFSFLHNLSHWNNYRHKQSPLYVSVRKTSTYIHKIRRCDAASKGDVPALSFIILFIMIIFIVLNAWLSFYSLCSRASIVVEHIFYLVSTWIWLSKLRWEIGMDIDLIWTYLLADPVRKLDDTNYVFVRNR